MSFFQSFRDSSHTKKLKGKRLSMWLKLFYRSQDNFFSQNCFIKFFYRVATTPIGQTRETLLKGKARYSWPPVLTCLDQLLFKMKIIFTFLTKQATLTRRSTVQSLLPQLVVFPGQTINRFWKCLKQSLKFFTPILSRDTYLRDTYLSDGCSE